MSYWAKLKEKLSTETAQIKRPQKDNGDGVVHQARSNAGAKGMGGRNGFSKKRKRHELSDAAER